MPPPYATATSCRAYAPNGSDAEGVRFIATETQLAVGLLPASHVAPASCDTCSWPGMSAATSTLPSGSDATQCHCFGSRCGVHCCPAGVLPSRLVVVMTKGITWDRAVVDGAQPGIKRQGLSLTPRTLTKSPTLASPGSVMSMVPAPAALTA